jgi:hypothetical protein
VFPWILLTAGARSAIIDSRLSCRKLHAGSIKTFATLLGDRIFRFTKVGTEDLRSIGQHVKIRPYITTLTIGCAGFKTERPDYLRRILGKLDQPETNRLLNAYNVGTQWHIDHVPQITNMFASLLRPFEKLDSLRIQPYHYPICLGGWLEDSDLDMIYRQCYFHHNRSAEALGLPLQYRPSTLPFDAYEKSIEVHSIIEALNHTRALKDVRIAEDSYRDALFTDMPVSKLKTLRMPVCSIHHGDNPARISQLASLLSRATNLEDIALESQVRTEEDLPAEPRLVMEALRDHTRLRRFVLLGYWYIDQPDFIDFVHRHAQSIRCIIFEEVTLSGSWRIALKSIADATRGRLQFFSGRNLHDETVPAHEQLGITKDDLASFDCSVEWFE